MGVSAKVEEAYWEVVEAYLGGARDIDIFGFSRGATEARALATVLSSKGIMDSRSFTTESVKTAEGQFDIQVRGGRTIVPGSLLTCPRS